MKNVLLATLVLALSAAPALASPNTYQVTGPVTAMTADSVTVQKGSEKWEIARGGASVSDTVKVGSKVTVQYFMTATTVTDKDAAKAKKK